MSRQENAPVNHSSCRCHGTSPGAITKAQMNFQVSVEVLSGIGHFFFNLIYSDLSPASFELSKLRSPDLLPCLCKTRKGKSKIFMGVFTCFATPYYFSDYSVIFVKCQNDLTRNIWAVVAVEKV